MILTGIILIFAAIFIIKIDAYNKKINKENKNGN